MALPLNIRQHILKESQRYTKELGTLIDPDIIEAKVFAESSNGTQMTSGVGAKGWLQLMPETFKSLGFTDINDPYQNISAGIKYYGQQRKKYGRDDLALAAYNGGPSNVDKYGGIPPFPETQGHVKKVLGLVRQKKVEDQRKLKNKDFLKDVGSKLPEKNKKIELKGRVEEIRYPSGF